MAPPLPQDRRLPSGIPRVAQVAACIHDGLSAGIKLFFPQKESASGPPRSNPSLTAAIALGDADRLTPSHTTLSVPHLKEPSHDHRHHQRWR
jgi:hypothetical protein